MNTLRSLRQNLVCVLWSVSDDLPCFRSPLVGFTHKEIRPRARENHFRVFPFLGGIERGLAPNNMGRVLAVSPLIAVHVAMGTTGRDLEAAVPRVPSRLSPFD